jgi:hypothetical protein
MGSSVFLSEYHQKDIFHTDKFELFFFLFPDKAYAFKDLDCHGDKRSKDRITVLVCASMDGSEKMPLVVTENQKTKLLQACEVPAMHYRHNSTTWMTWALCMELLT